MLSPDRDADAASSTYNVQIGKGKGIVIGNNAQVTQHFHETYSEPHVDLVAAEVTYRQKVVEVYSSLNFSGFELSNVSLANVPLENIFVRPTLTIEKVIREPLPAEPSSYTRRDGSRIRERIITVQEPIELDQALSHSLLIIGQPGAGKSTLLRWLAITFAQKRQQEPDRVGATADADRLPVFVELGRLPDRFLKPEGGEIPNWFQLLPKYLSSQIAFTDTPLQLLKQALAEGRCLLFFDGLDEIADRQARTRIALSLTDLARLSANSHNRIIIGSRPAGVNESEGMLGSQFRRCQINRFTPEEVQRLFYLWYVLDQNLSTEQQQAATDILFTEVQVNPATLQLAMTPLLGTILLLIWRNEGILPERQVDLYERCCRALIEDWENHHCVSYQGILSKIGWERHLRLLAPLAYFIHNREQRTNATYTELASLLVRGLQAEGLCSDASTALLEAEQFLSTLGLRSGLLHYVGKNEKNNVLYGFPHLAFQEYLVARYIAEQPYPAYIDFVMEHLHEAWWQTVHLLTIAHLGSKNENASKASALVLTILHAYKPPCRMLRPLRNRWFNVIGSHRRLEHIDAEHFFLQEIEMMIRDSAEACLRLIGQITPGRLLPHMQLERRIAWTLNREFELAAKGYAECACARTMTTVNAALSVRATSLLQRIIYDEIYPDEWDDRLVVICSRSQHQENKAFVDILLKALHDEHDTIARWRAAEGLGMIGAGNEVVVNELLRLLHTNDDKHMRHYALWSLRQIGVEEEKIISMMLNSLHNTDEQIKWRSAESLGIIGVDNEEMVNILLKALHSSDWDVQKRAAESLGEVAANNEAVVSELLKILHDDNDNLVRKRAAESLGKARVNNEVVVNALLEVLYDDNVRVAAVESLGQVGVGNGIVASALLKALHNESGYAQHQIAESLGRVGMGNEEVMDALLKALHDDSNQMRRYAVKILGNVGVGNKEVTNALLKALNSSDEYIRNLVAWYLGQMEMDNEEVINALLKALHDSDEDTRASAAKSLGQVGVGNEEVMNALLKALHDNNDEVRMRAVKSLTQWEIKNENQLHQVLITLNYFLHDTNSDGYNRSDDALTYLHQWLDNRPIPRYHWIPLQIRQAQCLKLKRITFWFGMVAIVVFIVLTITWLLDVFPQNSFSLYLFTIMVAIFAFVAIAAQIRRKALYNPWDHS